MGSCEYAILICQELHAKLKPLVMKLGPWHQIVLNFPLLWKFQQYFDFQAPYRLQFPPEIRSSAVRPAKGKLYSKHLFISNALIPRKTRKLPC